MDERLEQIQKLLDAAEGNLQSARNLLRSTLNLEGKPLDIQEKAASLDGDISADTIQGVFDGEKMIADGGKEYPVPANYASKSKLVEGDTLKLTIAADGSFIFKQINPVDRKNLVGTLSQSDGNYLVNAGGKDYKVLTASVTFYKAQPGDQVTVIVPAEHEATWAAMENVITVAPTITPEPEPVNPVIVEPDMTPMSEAPKEDIVPETNDSQAEDAQPQSAPDTTITPEQTSEEEVTPTPEQPTSDPNAPEIEFPGGEKNLSDDELLENLKNNLKNIQSPEYVSPQAVEEDLKKADVADDNRSDTGNNPKGDEPISELEI